MKSHGRSTQSKLRKVAFFFLLVIATILFVGIPRSLRNAFALISSPSPSIPAHVFLFHNDEPLLLLDWVIYHSNLLGSPENIHIVDHNSTEHGTLNLLKQLKASGVDIIPYYGSFTHKAAVISTVMQRFSGLGGSNNGFLIPLDSDEFLISTSKKCCQTESTFCVDQPCVRESLLKLPVDGKKYKFGMIYATNCGGKPLSKRSKLYRTEANKYFIERLNTSCMSKTFYHSQNFMSTDQGNHWGRVFDDTHKENYPDLSANTCLSRFHSKTNLALLHYTPSFEEYKGKLRRGAAAYGYDESLKKGVACRERSYGEHYCRAWEGFLKNGEEWLREMYDKEQKWKCKSGHTSNVMAEHLEELRKLNHLNVKVLKER